MSPPAGALAPRSCAGGGAPTAEPVHWSRILAELMYQASFPVLLATEGDHLKAADVANACAAVGLALSTPDALIAAQALNRRARLFTTDADFHRLPQAIGLRLF